MKLTENADYIQWPVTHYVFVEKIGPFQDTAQKCWEELHAGMPELLKTNKFAGFFSLYKIEPQMLYRAGVAVSEKPGNLPEGFRYEKFEGGKYARFTLTGSYSQLPEACGRVFATVEKENMSLRDGYFIENYLNDPKTTPEDQLLTEILLPVP